MALTLEQQEFAREINRFKVEAREAIGEAQQLALKVSQQEKRFKKIEKTIRDMAKDWGIKLPNK